MFKAILDYNGEKLGNPKFRIVNIVDDHKPTKPSHDSGKDRYCTPERIAVTLTRSPDQPSRMILCPLFFTAGATINGGPGREWPDTAKPVTCDTIGTRLSEAMWTAGSLMLHEYTHMPEIMEDVWRRGWKKKLGFTKDHAYGFESCKKIDRKLAISNADNYADFASELFWTATCNRDFDPPVADDFTAIDELIMLSGALDIDPTEGEDPSAEGGAAAKGDPSTATGTQQQKSQREIPPDLSLQKRTAFSQPYRYPVPKIDVDNTYTAEQMDQFLEGHVDALQLCRVVIKQSTKNPTGFDKIFREYFAPKDRELVISKFTTPGAKQKR